MTKFVKILAATLAGHPASILWKVRL